MRMHLLIQPARRVAALLPVVVLASVAPAVPVTTAMTSTNGPRGMPFTSLLAGERPMPAIDHVTGPVFKLAATRAQLRPIEREADRTFQSQPQLPPIVSEHVRALRRIDMRRRVVIALHVDIRRNCHHNFRAVRVSTSGSRFLVDAVVSPGPRPGCERFEPTGIHALHVITVPRRSLGRRIPSLMTLRIAGCRQDPGRPSGWYRCE